LKLANCTEEWSPCELYLYLRNFAYIGGDTDQFVILQRTHNFQLSPPAKYMSRYSHGRHKFCSGI